MKSVYKYMPSQFVDSVLNDGQLLFRNLSYFRQCEGRPRGDLFEGVHVDRPDNPVTIRNMHTGKVIRGGFRFLNSTDSDHIFGMCFSKKLDARLMKSFNADACIEIHDVDAMITRAKRALRRMVYIHPIGLLARPICYYNPNEAALLDIKDPVNLAFVKDVEYSEQAEFRLVFGNRRAFRLVQQIVQPGYDPYEEILNKVPAKRIVTIGCMHDIARVVRCV